MPSENILDFEKLLPLACGRKLKDLGLVNENNQLNMRAHMEHIDTCIPCRRQIERAAAQFFSAVEKAKPLKE